MSKIIRLIDRTRTVADWRCPRARYWGYEYNGRGVVRNATSLALSEGIAIHDALAAIAHLTLNEKPVPIDDIVQACGQEVYNSLMREVGDVIQKESEDYAWEQATLVRGLVYGFYKYMWPRLMAMYPSIVCVEQEMEYPLALAGPDDPNGVDYIFMTKPDLICETADGELVYIEYKSTSSKKDNWVNSWETAVQLHSSVKATEKSLGRLPSAVQIVGLYKGYESYGKQNSPFCYGYLKKGNPPFSKDEMFYDYKAGAKKSPVWLMSGGIKAWVDAMPDEVLANQFPLTPQIYVNEDLVGNFFKQRLFREAEILSSSGNEDLDRVFPQKFDQCKPSFGWGCSYVPLCHGGVDDPARAGFVPREPHHDAEREQLGLVIKEIEELS